MQCLISSSSTASTSGNNGDSTHSAVEPVPAPVAVGSSSQQQQQSFVNTGERNVINVDNAVSANVHVAGNVLMWKWLLFDVKIAEYLVKSAKCSN